MRAKVARTGERARVLMILFYFPINYFSTEPQRLPDLLKKVKYNEK
jgi:hypothetical protein